MTDACAVTYETFFATLNPCHWWKFGEASSPMADSGTCGDPAVMTDAYGTAATYHVPGIPNSTNFAVSGNTSVLIGTGGNILNEHPGAAQFWAALVWVKPASHAASQNIYNGGFGGIFFDWELTRGPGQNIAFGLYNSSAGGYYGQVVSSGGLVTDNLWHLIVGLTQYNTGTGAALSQNLFVEDGTHQFTNTTFTGSGNASCAGSSCRAYTFARNDSVAFYDGAIGHPAIILNNLTPATITLISTCGLTGVCTTGGGNDWPFNVKAPYMPNFRADDYFDRIISAGYNTGQFLARAIRPQFFNVGYVPLFPGGNFR